MRTINVKLPTGNCYMVSEDGTHYLPAGIKDTEVLEKFTSNDSDNIKVNISSEYIGWVEVKPYFGNKGGLFQIVNVEV